LKEKEKMKTWELETETGVYFWGGILSNWAKIGFTAQAEIDGAFERYNTSEQYMMRVKADLFKDADAATRVMATSDPRKQKAIGRSIQGYSDAVWDGAARDLTYPGVYAKFEQNAKERDLLLSTCDKIIVEASPLDTKWGVGLEHLDERIFDKSQWRGTNWLGHMLMRARDDLRAGTPPVFGSTFDWNVYQ
jgi:ribA/ribD-fused uncharacterized protein